MRKQKKRPVRGLGRAKGEPPRTARIRYMEPPAKKAGNPFVAVRVPRDIHRAFTKWCKAHKVSPAEHLRGHLSTITGIALTGVE